MTRRTATRPDVRVGGFWLSTIAPAGWGELVHSTRVRGSLEVSWQMPLERNWRHPALTAGAPVDLRLGPATLWPGILEEPDWDEGRFVAVGAHRAAEGKLALDASRNASTRPNEVVDAAIARGALPWTRVANLGNTPVGSPDDAGSLVYIDSVLDAWEQENGTRLRVNDQRQLVVAPISETNPTWYVTPGSGVLGAAGEKSVAVVFVRFINSATGLRDTASYPPSPAAGSEGAEDIRDRGPMTLAKATSIAESIWSELRGKAGWTNGLRLTYGQVTTPGGIEVDLALIKAGDTVRLLDVPDPRGLTQHTDVVIGDTEYDWTDDEIQINPVGMAARDEESVLEQVGNLAVDASRAAKAVESGADPTTAIIQLAGTTDHNIAHATWTTRALSTAAVRASALAPISATASGVLINVAGWYEITADVAWAINATGRRIARIVGAASSGTAASGTPSLGRAEGGPNTNGYADQVVTAKAYLDAGTHVRVEVYQTNSGSATLASINARMTVERI